MDNDMMNRDKVDRDNVDKDKDGQGQGGVSSSISRTFLELRSSFNWPSPISVPKGKLQSSQSGPFFVTGFTETAAWVG